MTTTPGDDPRDAMAVEVSKLFEAAGIIHRRFPTGKHDATAIAVRRAAAELQSRARHPSRQRPAPGTMTPEGQT